MSFMDTHPTTVRGLVAFVEHVDAINAAQSENAASPDFMDDHDYADAWRGIAPAIRAVLSTA
jgi:hypothetical protein